MQYFTNEVALDLPEGGIGDGTINVIQLVRQKASLAISRGQLEKGEDLKASLERQLQKVREQLKGLESQPARETKVGVDGDIPALETQNRLVLGDEQIHQYQVAFLLPGTRMMMSMTYGRNTPLTKEDAEHWASVKSGIRLRAK